MSAAIRRPGRLVAGIVLALVLVVALPTTVSALWSSRGTASATVTAGRVGFAQAGFEALAAVFGSTEASRVVVAPVTVRNAGTVPAVFTLQLGAESANNLARAVIVSVWAVLESGDCTTSTQVPAGVTGLDWPVVPAVTGSLAPSASAVYCVRAAISQANVDALPGDTMVGTLRLTGSTGSWTHEVRTRVTQSVASSDGGGSVSPMPTPIEPVGDGPVETPMPAPIDAMSMEPDAESLAADPDHSYSIASAGTTRCVGSASTEEPSPVLVTGSCDESSGQSWQLSAEEDGYRSIVSASDPSRAWTAAGTRVRLTAGSAESEQQWATRSNADGSTSVASGPTGECLTAVPAAAGGGVPQPLVLAACDGSAAQSFTLVTRS